MGERIGLDVMNTLYDATVALVEQARDGGDFDGFKLELFRTFALECPVTEDTFREAKTDALTDQVFKAVMEQYKRRTERMAQVADPVIRQVFENQGAMYENIMIPVTDGKRMYNVSCNLKEAYDTHSRAIVKAFQKAVTLLTIDEAWKEHLRDMDDLRQSVQNASYENKDPLLIYKLEAYNLFKTMVETMNRKTVAILMRGQIPVQEAPDEERQAAPEVRQAVPERRTDMSRYRTEKDDADAAPRSADSEGTQPQPPPGGPPGFVVACGMRPDARLQEGHRVEVVDVDNVEPGQVNLEGMDVVLQVDNFQAPPLQLVELGGKKLLETHDGDAASLVQESLKLGQEVSVVAGEDDVARIQGRDSIHRALQADVDDLHVGGT